MRQIRALLGLIFTTIIGANLQLSESLNQGQFGAIEQAYSLPNGHLLILQNGGKSTKKLTIENELLEVVWSYERSENSELLCLDQEKQLLILIDAKFNSKRSEQEDCVAEIIDLQQGLSLQKQILRNRFLASAIARKNILKQCANDFVAFFSSEGQIVRLNIKNLQLDVVVSLQEVSQLMQLKYRSSTDDFLALYTPLRTGKDNKQEDSVCIASIKQSQTKEIKSCYIFSSRQQNKESAAQQSYGRAYTTQGLFIVQREQQVYFISQLDYYTQREDLSWFSGYNEEINDTKIQKQPELITFANRPYFLSVNTNASVYKLFRISRDSKEISLMHEFFVNTLEGQKVSFFQRSDDEILYFRYNAKGKAKAFIYSFSERYERRAAYLQLGKKFAISAIHQLQAEQFQDNQGIFTDSSSNETSSHSLAFLLTSNTSDYALAYSVNHMQTHLLAHSAEWLPLEGPELKLEQSDNEVVYAFYQYLQKQEQVQLSSIRSVGYVRCLQLIYLRACEDYKFLLYYFQNLFIEYWRQFF